MRISDWSSDVCSSDLAEDLRRVKWTLPEPFEGVVFAVNGFGGRLWRPEPCARLGVISPFCDEDTLTMLAELPNAEKPIFVGRADELAGVPREALEQLDRKSTRLNSSH